MNQTQYAKHCGITQGRVSQLYRAGKLIMVGKFIDAEKTNEYLMSELDSRGNPHTQRIEPECRQRYITQKTKEAYWSAENKRITAQQRASELVETKKVRQEALKQVQLLREAILSMPDNLSARLAAESDPIAVHTILTTAARDLLNNLAMGRAV